MPGMEVATKCCKHFAKTHLLENVGQPREIANFIYFLADDNNGKFKCTNGIAKDITKRIQLEKEQKNTIDKLQKSINEVKILRGILPICSYCKKIRDDKGYWQQVEGYIRDHSEAEFTHGMCPDCYKREIKKTVRT